MIAVDVTKDGEPAWLITHAMPTSLNKGKTRKKMIKRKKRKGKGKGNEVAVKPGRRPPVVTADTQIGPDVDLDREDVRLLDGTRLTNDLAEAVNEDVRRAVGRPSLSGGRQHSPQVSARITPELQAELRKYSKRSGLSSSQVVRHALEQLVGSRLPEGTASKQQAPAKRPRRASRKDPAGRS